MMASGESSVRKLGASVRPLIGIGVALSPVFLIGIAAWVHSGFDFEMLKLLLCVCGLYGFFVLFFISVTVEVTDTTVCQRIWFIWKKEISFSEIDRSDVQFLAERDHPISMSIYRRDEDAPALGISLKAVSKDDVAWLIRQPQLKVQVYRGFTKAPQIRR